MQIEHIYGIDYTPPPYPKKETIANYRELFGDQVFTRTVIPESFNEIDFDDEGNAILTTEQDEFVQSELDRIMHGHYFFNRGQITYITGVHYFYLQYYTLEDGNQPDYRETDRKWFCFMDYCISKQYIKGIIRIKKRREGASSQAACFLLWSALTCPNSNCGIISKTDKDAKDVFQKMISPAFNKLPAFLKPRVEDSESKTQLVFAKPKSTSRKKKELKGLYNKDRGLESKIDFRATGLNSYDSGRVTAILVDEGGKWSIEVPINQYWPIVRKTLNKGINRVGFALIVSTVNESAKGGAAFKEIWDDSNHFDNKTTGTGLYRYFSPAYEGLDGFIDKHGFSITENASEMMKQMMLEVHGEAYDGSIDYCKKERAKITDPVALSEEIRMMPFNEKEAFMISQQKCHFSVAKIQAQIDYLLENKAKHVLRRGKLYPKDDGTVEWMDLEDGPWHVLKFPTLKERNRSIMTDDGWKAPANMAKYATGIDPHRHQFTKGKKDLSDTCAWVMERYDENDPENTGLPVAFYSDRPPLKSHMYDQMIFAGVFWGTRVTFETDAGDDYYPYIKSKGLHKYIRWTPTCAVNPLKPGSPVPGVSSKDPFALSKQLELGIAYIEHHAHKIFFMVLLKQLLIYEHEDRQKYDEVVSFLIALIDLMGDTKPLRPEVKRDKPIIATYNLIEQYNKVN